MSSYAVNVRFQIMPLTVASSIKLKIASCIFLLRFSTQLRLRMWFRLQCFSMEGIGIAISIAKIDAQPTRETNGNRNRVINLRCEWTLGLYVVNCNFSTESHFHVDWYRKESWISEYLSIYHCIWIVYSHNYSLQITIYIICFQEKNFTEIEILTQTKLTKS